MCQLQTLKAAAEKGKQAVGFGSVKVLKKSQNVFKVCCQHKRFQSTISFALQPASKLCQAHVCNLCSMHGPAEILYKEALLPTAKPWLACDNHKSPNDLRCIVCAYRAFSVLGKQSQPEMMTATPCRLLAVSGAL